MSRSDAKEFLQRMARQYPAPQHLRRDQAAREQMLADYEQALSPFDADTLGKAWAKVVSEHRYWCWPNAGTLVAACRAFAPSEEQRRQRALDMADAYTARYFKTSQLAKLAQREGWRPQLRQYVEAAAWVQAECICGVRSIGWSPDILLPHAEDHHSSREMFVAYRPAVEQAVKHGRIRVHVPAERIRAWREQGQGREAAPRVSAAER
jgi:hypothetical protein